MCSKSLVVSIHNLTLLILWHTMVSASGSPAWPDSMDKLGAKMMHIQIHMASNETSPNCCDFWYSSFFWISCVLSMISAGQAIDPKRVSICHALSVEAYATLPNGGGQARHSESKSWLSHVFTSLGPNKKSKHPPLCFL